MDSLLPRQLLPTLLTLRPLDPHLPGLLGLQEGQDHGHQGGQSIGRGQGHIHLEGQSTEGHGHHQVAIPKVTGEILKSSHDCFEKMVPTRMVTMLCKWQ